MKNQMNNVSENIYRRLDGKKKKKEFEEDLNNKPVYTRGIPDYNYEIGTLQFFRHSKPVPQTNVSG